jgi:hypothetical protein
MLMGMFYGDRRNDGLAYIAEYLKKKAKLKVSKKLLFNDSPSRAMVIFEA